MAENLPTKRSEADKLIAKMDNEMTPAERGGLLGNLKRAEKLIKALLKHAKANAEQERGWAKGWIVSQGTVATEINDTRECFRILHEKGLLTAEDFAACTKVSIGNLRRAVYTKQKKDAVARDLKPKTHADIETMLGDILTPVTTHAARAGKFEPVLPVNV